MTLQPVEELRIPFDPTHAQQKVRRWRRLLVGQVVSFLLTCAILLALYLWRRDEMGGTSTVVIYAAILGGSLLWLAFYVLAYRRARKDLASVGTGLAVCIDRNGVQVADQAVPWAEIDTIRTVRGGVGRGARLEVLRTSGQSLAVPLDDMDVRPATLDLTARAYSGGRHGVDLRALDI